MQVKRHAMRSGPLQNPSDLKCLLFSDFFSGALWWNQGLGEYAIARLSQTCRPQPQTKSSVVLICLEDFFSCQLQYHGLHLCSPVLNEALNNQRQNGSIFGISASRRNRSTFGGDGSRIGDKRLQAELACFSMVFHF